MVVGVSFKNIALNVIRGFVIEISVINRNRRNQKTCEYGIVECLIPVVIDASVGEFRSKGVVKLSQGKHEIFVKEKQYKGGIFIVRIPSEDE